MYTGGIRADTILSYTRYCNDIEFYNMNDQEKKPDTENVVTTGSTTPPPVTDTAALKAVTTGDTSSTPSDETSVITGTEVVSDPVTVSEPLSTSSPDVKADVTSSTMTTTPSVMTPVSRRKTALLHYGVAAIIILIMAGGLWFILEQQGRVKTAVFSTVSTFIFGEPAAVVVNGEKVPLSLYEKNVAQLTVMAREQQLDPNEPQIAEEIKKQTVDLLVNTEILRQAATDAGVTVSDEEVETRYQDIVSQLGSEAELEKRLTEIGNTTISLRADIAAEILIQKHLDAAVDVTSIAVTDEEIKTQYDDMVAFYESQAGGAELEIPTFVEAKDSLSERIRSDKEQKLVTDYIETLKSESSIEVRI